MTLSDFVTSSRNGTILSLPPHTVVTSFSAAVEMSPASTLAPSSTKRRQIAEPIPPAAPVTNATFPANLAIFCTPTIIVMAMLGRMDTIGM
ncbi:hypothetical protein D9M68_696220 [compost metagenome]